MPSRDVGYSQGQTERRGRPELRSLTGEVGIMSRSGTGAAADLVLCNP